MNERAGLELLRALSALGYSFVTVTPETHRRVVARPDRAHARDLRGVFGWSLEFEEGLLPPDLFAALRSGGLVERCVANSPGGSSPSSNSRLQPNTSRRSRAWFFPGRATTRLWVSGVTVTKE